MSDLARRMYEEALTRINDADILARVYAADMLADPAQEPVLARSDSQQLLRILAFEVLLKCAIRLCGKTPAWNHEYAVLWQDLTPDVQSEILTIARERMPGHADLSDLDRLLNQYKFIFTRARYYYQLREGDTLQQQHDRGQRWLKRGAPESDADVRYYANELDCLIAGLCVFIEARLAGTAS